VAYLHHESPFNELGVWANIAMMEADFEEGITTPYAMW
jgi:hypothetical protein